VKINDDALAQFEFFLTFVGVEMAKGNFGDGKIVHHEARR